MNKSTIIILTGFLSVLASLVIFFFTPIRYSQIVEPQIKDIPSQEFYRQFAENTNDFIFIDVRGEEAFKRIHATGSINMPLHTLYDQRHNLPKNEKRLVLICSGGSASGVAYSYLEHYGFSNIQRISGGIESWVEEGLPIETGD